MERKPSRGCHSLICVKAEDQEVFHDDRLVNQHASTSGKWMLCRPDWVIDQTFDLFVELGATDDQCDFPVIYASGVNGIAGDSPDNMAQTLEPLFEAVVREV